MTYRRGRPRGSSAERGAARTKHETVAMMRTSPLKTAADWRIVGAARLQEQIKIVVGRTA